jgi:hypothetical protein
MYTVEGIEINMKNWMNNYGFTREDCLTSMFISAASDKYHSTYASVSAFVIGQEEVEVECGGLDYESSANGYPLYMNGLEYIDGELISWYEDSIGNTVGCIYSDGTKEYWGTLPSTNDGSVKFLTKLK